VSEWVCVGECVGGGGGGTYACPRLHTHDTSTRTNVETLELHSFMKRECARGDSEE
jgi:hypothetical protein